MRLLAKNPPVFVPNLSVAGQPGGGPQRPDIDATRQPYGITAVAWFEFALSLPLESTAVVT
jgi:hypothetical protein